MAYHEAKYWELREACERAHDRMMGAPTTENQVNYVDILRRYQDFCMDALEILVDKNEDILKELD